MPISESDCAAEGGHLEDPWTCVLPMSEQRCTELGGKLDAKKQCRVD